MRVEITRNRKANFGLYVTWHTIAGTPCAVVTVYETPQHQMSSEITPHEIRKMIRELQRILGE